MMSSSSCWLSERSVGSLETCRRQLEDPHWMEPDSREGQGALQSPPTHTHPSSGEPGYGLTECPPQHRPQAYCRRREAASVRPTLHPAKANAKGQPASSGLGGP